MNLLVDTHVLVWWYLDAPKLPERYRVALDGLKPAGPAHVSAISLWEIAKLVERGRMQLAASLDELLGQVESDPLFEVIPISARIAAESTRLGTSFPRDPADQLIAATARCHGLSLMTCDEAIRRSSVVAVHPL